MNRRVVVIVAIAAGVVLLAIAAGVGIRSYLDEEARLTPPSPKPTPEFDGEAELAAFVAEYGEAPPREPYTEAERETARQMEIELLRLTTLNIHPSAAMPSPDFVAYDDAARATCLAEAGVRTDYTYGAPVLEDETQALAAYSCLGTFPPEPHGRPTDRQLHYVYAYWTAFLVPCYEAFGYPQSTPIPEDQFVALYPMQVWHPDYPEDPWSNDPVNTHCPSSIGGA